MSTLGLTLPSLTDNDRLLVLALCLLLYREGAAVELILALLYIAM